MIEHIPELCESGLSCLKIEGRMKSSCYAATVTNTYKMAIDRYFESPENYVYDPVWMKELESVSHREYCTGFFFGDAMDNANICETPGYIREQAALGVAYSYDSETGRAYFTQKNKFSVGEELELLVPGKTAISFKVGKIWDENGAEIESVPHPMMKFAIEVPTPIPEFSLIRYAP